MGVDVLRASQAVAVRIEDHQVALRGHRVLNLVGKVNKLATMSQTVSVLPVLEARSLAAAAPDDARPLDRPIGGPT